MGQVSEGKESLGLCECTSEHGSVCVQRRGAALRGLWRIPHLLGGVILLFPVPREELQPSKLPWRAAVGRVGKNAPQEPSLSLLSA